MWATIKDQAAAHSLPPAPSGMGRTIVRKKVKLSGLSSGQFNRTTQGENYYCSITIILIKEYTKRMVQSAITHHSYHKGQPILESDLCSLLPAPPGLHTKHVMVWYWISPCLTHINCPGCTVSKLPVITNSILAKPRTLVEVIVHYLGIQ